MATSDLVIDFSFFWSWVLIFTRMTGVFYGIPGIGTEQVPESFRMFPALIVSACVAIGGVHAQAPATMAEGGAMLVVEFLLGWAFGLIPQLTLAGLTVAGQLVAGAIGLAQANMIDVSLGESVSILSRIKSQIAILIFLFMDGHHIVLRAASGIAGDIGVGVFRPGMDTFLVLLERFTQSFQLALVVSAPIIVAGLLTQFVLGLLTKFVPQVNVFIISMPLNILAGLYIIIATLYGLANHSYADLTFLEETLARLALSGQPR